MQSLVLATSLLLSSQSPIAASDIQQELSEFVQSETNRVVQFVHYKEKVAAQDTFLYQAKLVINQAKKAKKDRVSNTQVETVTGRGTRQKCEVRDQTVHAKERRRSGTHLRRCGES